MDYEEGTKIKHPIYGAGTVKCCFKNGDTVYKLHFHDIDHPLFLSHESIEKIE